jgi:predicted Zn-dependent protease
LRDARDYARGQQIRAEFLFHREHSSLIRLGNSAVALSTFEDLTRLDVTVQEGRRTGSYGFLADIASEQQLRDALRRAQENCRTSLEKQYDPIFGVVEEPVDDARGFDPDLDDLAPAFKADFCASVVHALKPRGDIDFSGSWSSGMTEVYYVSTANDKEAYRKLTDGRLVLVLKEQNQKWELSVEQGGRGKNDFSAAQAIAEFEQLLPVYQNHEGFHPLLGHQRVIFGPQSISQLVGLALWSGFLGRGWEEQRAFTSRNKFGDRLFSEAVTIADDPSDPNVFSMPFDGKGKRRRRLVLAEQGIFRGLIYTSETAAKYGKPPTGHDTGTGDFVFAPGSGPDGLEAAKRLAGDALYIPHLHYIHLPDPARGMLTGSSRFNALRVEQGEFTAPLFSSRITDTIPNVLSHVVAIAPRSILLNVSSTYGRRTPEATSVPEYLICDNVRISDVADSF